MFNFPKFSVHTRDDYIENSQPFFNRLQKEHLENEENLVGDYRGRKVSAIPETKKQVKTESKNSHGTFEFGGVKEYSGSPESVKLTKTIEDLDKKEKNALKMADTILRTKRERNALSASVQILEKLKKETQGSSMQEIEKIMDQVKVDHGLEIKMTLKSNKNKVITLIPPSKEAKSLKNMNVILSKTLDIVKSHHSVFMEQLKFSDDQLDDAFTGLTKVFKEIVDLKSKLKLDNQKNSSEELEKFKKQKCEIVVHHREEGEKSYLEFKHGLLLDENAEKTMPTYEVKEGSQELFSRKQVEVYINDNIEKSDKKNKSDAVFQVGQYWIQAMNEGNKEKLKYEVDLCNRCQKKTGVTLSPAFIYKGRFAVLPRVQGSPLSSGQEVKSALEQMANNGLMMTKTSLRDFVKVGNDVLPSSFKHLVDYKDDLSGVDESVLVDHIIDYCINNHENTPEGLKKGELKVVRLMMSKLSSDNKDTVMRHVPSDNSILQSIVPDEHKSKKDTLNYAKQGEDKSDKQIQAIKDDIKTKAHDKKLIARKGLSTFHKVGEYMVKKPGKFNIEDMKREAHMCNEWYKALNMSVIPAFVDEQNETIVMPLVEGEPIYYNEVDTAVQKLVDKGFIMTDYSGADFRKLHGRLVPLNFANVRKQTEAEIQRYGRKSPKKLVKTVDENKKSLSSNSTTGPQRSKSPKPSVDSKTTKPEHPKSPVDTNKKSPSSNSTTGPERSKSPKPSVDSKTTKPGRLTPPRGENHKPIPKLIPWVSGKIGKPLHPCSEIMLSFITDPITENSKKAGKIVMLANELEALHARLPTSALSRADYKKQIIKLCDTYSDDFEKLKEFKGSDAYSQLFKKAKDAELSVVDSYFKNTMTPKQIEQRKDLIDRLLCETPTLTLVEILPLSAVQISDKISQAMSVKISADESSFENITVPNRPMNIADRYKKMNSEEWLSAKQEIDEYCDQLEESSGAVIENRKKLKALASVFTTKTTDLVKLGSPISKDWISRCIDKHFENRKISPRFKAASDYMKSHLGAGDVKFENEYKSEIIELTNVLRCSKIPIFTEETEGKSAKELINEKNRLVDIVINDMNKLMGTEVSAGDMPDLRNYITNVLELAVYMSIQKPPMEFDFKEKMIADLNNTKVKLTPVSLGGPPYYSDLCWGSNFEKDGSLFDPLVVFPVITHDKKPMSKSCLYGGREIEYSASETIDEETTDEETTVTDDEPSKADDLSKTNMKVTTSKNTDVHIPSDFSLRERKPTSWPDKIAEHYWSIQCHEWLSAKEEIDEYCDQLEKSSGVVIENRKKLKALASVFTTKTTDLFKLGSPIRNDWVSRCFDDHFANRKISPRLKAAGNYMKSLMGARDEKFENEYKSEIEDLTKVLKASTVPIFTEETKGQSANELINEKKPIS